MSPLQRPQRALSCHVLVALVLRRRLGVKDRSALPPVGVGCCSNHTDDSAAKERRVASSVMGRAVRTGTVSEPFQRRVLPSSADEERMVPVTFHWSWVILALRCERIEDDNLVSPSGQGCEKKEGRTHPWSTSSATHRALHSPLSSPSSPSSSSSTPEGTILQILMVPVRSPLATRW